MQLKPRKILAIVERFLNTDNIIVIHGARQTGKTSLLYLLMEKTDPNVFIDLKDSRYREVCDAGHQEFVSYLRSLGHDLKEKIYVYLDEIQYLKNPSEFLKLLHDHYPQIKLIVSAGSSFEIKSKFKDSLVGRTVNFVLYPLDFQEFLWFNDVSIDLNNLSSEFAKKELKPLFEKYVLYGGYPKIVLTDDISKKETYLQQIIDTYIYRDIRDLARIKDVEKFNRLVRILAGQSANLLKQSQLSVDVRISKQTLAQYLFILESTYIIRRIYPYSRNVKTELTKLPKVFFIDTGLMNMLIFKRLPAGVTGQMFETAVFAELLKNKYLGYELYFWRTKHGQEVDFVVEIPENLWAIEVKINASKVLQKHLKSFSDKYPKAKPLALCLENIDLSSICHYPYELWQKIQTDKSYNE